MKTFFEDPEVEIILKIMSGDRENSKAQIPLFVEGVRFNLIFVYNWIYIWGLSFSKLADFLVVPEDKLLAGIKDVVDAIKEQINPSSFNKTLELGLAVFPPLHTSIVPQSSSEGLDR